MTFDLYAYPWVTYKALAESGRLVEDNFFDSSESDELEEQTFCLSSFTNSDSYIFHTRVADTFDLLHGEKFEGKESFSEIEKSLFEEVPKSDLSEALTDEFTIAVISAKRVKLLAEAVHKIDKEGVKQALKNVADIEGPYATEEEFLGYFAKVCTFILKAANEDKCITYSLGVSGCKASTQPSNYSNDTAQQVVEDIPAGLVDLLIKNIAKTNKEKEN